jgi:hypothetical protein
LFSLFSGHFPIVAANTSNTVATQTTKTLPDLLRDGVTAAIKAISLRDGYCLRLTVTASRRLVQSHKGNQQR